MNLFLELVQISVCVLSLTTVKYLNDRESNKGQVARFQSDIKWYKTAQLNWMLITL